MSDNANVLELSAEFERPEREAWLALVEKALKGGDFEKRLVSKTADGLRIEPLYMPAKDAQRITRTNAGKPWRVAARVDHPMAAEASRQALEDLKNAVDMLTLVFPGSRSARGFGLPCQSLSDLDTALEGVALDMIALRLDPAPAGRIHAGLVAALVEKRGLNPRDCQIDFGLDPVGMLMHKGKLPADWEEVGRRVTDVVTTLREKGFQGPFITCDVRAVHEAGGSPAQELAVALASGVAYLRALTSNGLSLADAAQAISFTLAIDADQFLGMAKLRALRRLWARVIEASGGKPEPVTIHAESAWRMMSKRDAWVNMLRTTMATFTAGIGGADSVTVLPFTQPLGLPDAFARRIARNTQTVLLEESNLWRVADPAAGSGAYEALTDELSDASWKAFQEIEAEGGIIESLASGKLHERITAVRTERQEQVATRKIALTGTSEFPMLAESPIDVLNIQPDPARGALKLQPGTANLSFADVIEKLAGGAVRSDVTPTPGENRITVTPLPSTRLAEPFEALRDESDRQLAASGKRPEVFLASLGRIVDHTARSTWIRNLMAAGGIEAKQQAGFATTTEAIEAFKTSGAKIACVCSSDDVYADRAVETVAALKEAGALAVYVAGRPGELEADLKAAGTDAFIFAGQDMLVLLSGLQQKLAA